MLSKVNKNRRIRLRKARVTTLLIYIGQIIMYNIIKLLQVHLKAIKSKLRRLRRTNSKI